MSWINTKSRRSFDFTAPYNEEGERLVTVPFPVAVVRTVKEGEIVHDANPALVAVAPTAAETIGVETTVQAGSLMIITNTGAEVATIGGVECAADKVTTLMYDGNGYISIGTSDITA